MNFIQKFRAILAARKALSNLTEANMKSGWKTTEFWMTVATNVVAIVGALKGVLPDNTAAAIVAGSNAVYAIARALTKAAAVTPAATPAK